MELSREQKRLRFRVEHKQTPMGMFTVRYSIHDKYKGTFFYQELESYANTLEEAQKIKAPSTGHVISITLNLNKLYSRRPVEERINWITMRAKCEMCSNDLDSEDEYFCSDGCAKAYIDSWS